MDKPGGAIRREERSRASLNIRAPVLGNATVFLFCVKNHAFANDRYGIIFSHRPHLDKVGQKILSPYSGRQVGFRNRVMPE
ncbi:MAG: hypothetical protein ABIW02_02100 [Nitrosospira sp.]